MFFSRRLQLSFFVVILSILACHAPVTVAPKDSAETTPDIPALRDFPKQNYILKENTVLLFKESFTADQVSAVLKGAKEKEILENKYKKFKKEYDSTSEKVKTYEDPENPPSSQEERIAEIDLLLKEKMALFEEKLKDPNALEEVKNLKQEIQALQDEKALREKLIEFIKEDEVFYQKQVALSLEIGKNAEICEQPPSLVKLVFQEGGSLQVTLNNWKYREKQKARNFSTEKNTIRNVTYKPNGGAFEFDVVVTEEKLKMEQEVLFFKIRRVRYNETDKTGKIFFNGEFIRKPNPDYCAALHMADLCVDRYGIVKFNSEDAKED